MLASRLISYLFSFSFPIIGSSLSLPGSEIKTMSKLLPVYDNSEPSAFKAYKVSVVTKFSKHFFFIFGDNVDYFHWSF